MILIERKAPSLPYIVREREWTTINFIFWRLIILKASLMVDAFEALREKRHKIPEPKNINCMTDLMVLHEKSGQTTHVFLIQDKETERVWLHEVKSAPESPEETEAIMREDSFYRWGDTVTATHLSSSTHSKEVG